MTSPPPSDASDGEAGFTLFELIAYLAVAATIGLAIANATTVFNQGGSANTRRLQAITRVEIGLRTLSDSLAQIRRVVVGDPERPSFVFSGAPDAVAFVRLGSGPDEGLPQAERLALVDGPDGTAVTRQTMPLEEGTTDLSSIAWPAPVRVFAAPVRLRFSYRAPTGGDWLPAWVAADRMPRQIRLDAGEGRASGLAVPPLVVTLPIDAEPGCTADEPSGCTLASAGLLKAGGP